MQSSKRYTNTTFTKRVDHEAGRSRASRAVPEPQVCGQCGAIRTGRHWAWPEASQVRSLRALGEFVESHPILCTACQQKRDDLPEGFLTVNGQFLSTHGDEIASLLRNVAERAEARNPMSRLLHWDRPVPGGILISTTSGRLALRLGRALRRAFDGEVQISFSHENRLTRVTWHRDA